jgi:hypothetical protein
MVDGGCSDAPQFVIPAKGGNPAKQTITEGISRIPYEITPFQI